MSTEKTVYYIASKRHWTDDGNSYMKKLIAKNPYPTRDDKLKMEADTGISLSIINSRMQFIRTQSKKEKVVATLEDVVEKERGAAQYFLNIISMEQRMELYDTMMKYKVYNEIINDEHIKPTLKRGQLEIMTVSSTGHDGSYFAKWLFCLISEEDRLSVDYGRLTLCRNSKTYSVVKKQINQTCK
ncbi:unnamed protein product [Adineta steineri]|uniref:Uncharacterized protein n=1 Tax=Adineta steineri TaxID=433720 RepID=A0A818QDA2_9BILA|nr:unnamed protein product [Adineta steineri]CAF3632998.1 unnamed protein product [Adineta steineri]